MLRSVVLAAVVGVSSVLAQTTCSLENKCPESAPCCGQYGDCGVGAFCLGGCDPRMSFSMDSCLPAPTCEDKSLRLNTLDNIQHISEYLGDPSEADWVASGEPALRNGNVLLTMPKDSVGTVMSSTTYMWYGNVKARLRTSRGRGVITAFILFSDIKDEIDYEWVGVDLETTQTNFYFQGITNYENSGNVTLSNTFFNWHDYEIRWTPDRIEWVIDGEVGRTQLREDTWNATSNQFEFPQTPSRVQLSLWPGGLATNGQGTIDWAGGEMDWEHEDVRNAGFFYAMAESVEIECWSGDGRLGSSDGRSYSYNNARGTNDTVVLSDDETTIGSLSATGLDPRRDEDEDEEPEDNNDDNNDDDDEDEEDEPASVPGGIIHQPPRAPSDETSNGGNPNNPGSNGGGGGGDTSSGSENPNFIPPEQNGCQVNSFHVNCDSDEPASADGSNNEPSSSSKASASALAIIIAGCALYWL